MPEITTQWYRVLGLDELPESRVKTVVAGHKSLALTHYKGQYGALDNRCPHQGGPLGEGSIENGLLRCPWHGWDYCPLTGKSPDALDVDDALATFPVEVRADGIYVGLPVEQPHTRTVSDVMAETMVNWGITHVFGMVGHSNLGLADALRRQEVQGKLTYIGIRHEGAAAFAASAYAKLTGKPAACLTIAGPGATNLLTGMWDAKVDRAPILALTGQVNSQVLGTGNFQECDLQAAFSGVAAWSQTVLSHSQHAELMTLAVKHALLERNVSHLIFPDEVQMQPAVDVPASNPAGRMTPLQIAPPPESLLEAIDRLKQSRRPVIIVGHGARFHMPAITELAELLGAPILTTFKGKGQISDRHPLGCGVLGRSGTPIASWFMNEADVLLVLGASFSNHTGIYPGKPIIQVDFDPLALGKFHPVEVPVWGEISVVVEQLNTALTGQVDTEDVRSQIQDHWTIWRTEKARREADDRGQGLNSASIFAAMTRQVSADAVIAVDVGNNTYSFGRYFECQAQSVLMSGYLGSIGFAFPAAMGAWAAAGHERRIISVSGDGGFGQYLAEFTTAVKYQMNITHILLHNDQLGKISKEQRAGEWDVWQTSLHNPDFSKYAQNCGGFGIRVTQQNELDDAIAQALTHQGPALVEIMSDPELI
ncbi:Putative thiamine pyrophosphate-containing protein YdaP [Acaryochloris thomasi RCC1774]|uniref:Thiamine pyrophosphate-containing protein YdaP n=1 Tax=Acaryochloris thomasi RCC1774 TaxID=1764569 RepID=A0A2W1JV84_9CYAN|nr:thiamine pyrophosphate-binding protein [Acaryochloris thomasi]PZD72681.1 Putative thiamine pyrophosphate-containing protein YdaP [Acaryochloris thomasi RCC1774]